MTTLKEWYEYNQPFFERQTRCEICLYKRYLLKGKQVRDRMMRTSMDFDSAIELFGDCLLISFYGVWETPTTPRIVATIVKPDGILEDDLAG